MASSLTKEFRLLANDKVLHSKFFSVASKLNRFMLNRLNQGIRLDEVASD